MSASDSIKIYILGDASGFKKAAGQVEASSKKFSGTAKVAIAGGLAAIGGAAFKAIGNFQDLALSVSKFSQASGIGAEAASRLIEATGDLGVEQDALAGAVNKFNKGIGDGGKAVSEYGIQVAKTKDGLTDVNQTFANALVALQGMKDPTERAAAATKLFGKSWADLAPLIDVADTLGQKINAVGDAQVIDEKEIAKAKKFRDQMDGLNDKVQGLYLSLGEALLPVVGKFADVLAGMDPKLVAVGLGTLGLVAAVGKLASAFNAVSAATPSIFAFAAANPMLLALGAAILAVVVLRDHMDELGDSFTKAGYSLARLLGLDPNPGVTVNGGGVSVAAVKGPLGPPAPGSLTQGLAPTVGNFGTGRASDVTMHVNVTGTDKPQETARQVAHAMRTVGLAFN